MWHIHTHTHTHTGILLSHKKWNHAIWGKIDGSRGYHAKWNKSDRERPIPWLSHLYVESKTKQNKTNEHTKQKQTHGFREQIGGCQRGGGWGIGWNRWRRFRGTNFQFKTNKSGDIKYSTRNMVNVIVIILYGDRGLLDL